MRNGFVLFTIFFGYIIAVLTIGEILFGGLIPHISWFFIGIFYPLIDERYRLWLYTPRLLVSTITTFTLLVPYREFMKSTLGNFLISYAPDFREDEVMTLFIKKFGMDAFVNVVIIFILISEIIMCVLIFLVGRRTCNRYFKNLRVM